MLIKLGDSMSKKTTVILPEHMKEQADHFGKIHAEICGYSPNSEAYKKAYRDGFYRFCHESYSHSMTPSGLLGANPTPRISQANYDVMIGWVDGIAEKKGLKKKEINDIKIQIRTAITILTHQYLRLMTDINVKRVKRKDNAIKDELSSMEYPANRADRSPYENMLALLETEKMRFVRLFIAATISAFVQFIFMISTYDMGKKIIDKFLNPVFEKPENLGLTNQKNIGSHLKKLRSKSFRAEFITNVKADILSNLKKSNKKFKLQTISRKDLGGE